MLTRDLRGLAVSNKIHVGICPPCRGCLQMRVQCVGGRMVGGGGVGVMMPRAPIYYMLSFIPSLSASAARVRASWSMAFVVVVVLCAWKCM